MKPSAIQFLNFQRENGRETDPSSKVFVYEPPKKVGRGREQDRLLIYMMFNGNASPANLDPDKLAEDLSTRFYNSAGGTTSALKIVVEQLNTYLVDENMRSTSKGNYRFGCMVLFNLRGNLLTLVQAGPSQVYQIGNESKVFHDPKLAGTGLGISPSPKMYFAQARLEDGETFLVSVEQPGEWDQAVKTVRASTPLENIKRRLLGVTRENAVGLLIQYSDNNDLEGGHGPTSVHMPQSITEQALGQSPVDSLPVEDNAAELGQATVVDRRTRLNDRHKAQRRQVPRADLSGLALGLLGILQQMRTIKDDTVEWIESTLFKVAPSNEQDRPVKLASNRTGLFVALALPILVLIISQFFYSNIGYDAKYSVYIEHAKADIAKANSEVNEEIRRVDWQSALSWIEKAELSSSELDPEATSLKELAQSQLDLVNKIVRVKYVPTMTVSLTSPLNISRMVASDSDLYFLDVVANKVLRASFNGETYDMDPSFKCEAGPISNGDGTTTDVGRLVEILPLVRSTNNSATLLAIDENAHLLYCSPGGQPKASSLVIPDQGIKQITSVALFDHAIYLLDAVGGSVWYYQGDLDWQFTDMPRFFFNSQIPADLETARSIAITGDDLYILFTDGHLANCVYSRNPLKETTCDDPKLYTETRAGYTGGKLLGDGKFTQLVLTLPPSVAVLFLEPNSQSIYNFSPVSVELRSNIRTRLDESNLLPKNQPVQLMSVSPNKTLYLLVGNQIYTSPMNP